MKYLVCRISWMKTYRSKDERPFSFHRYIVEKNRPYEALNFQQQDDGTYHGYVPVGSDATGKFGKISIDRLGAKPSEKSISNVTVIFCAPNELKGGLRVVGFYRDATVLREPNIEHDQDGDETVVRIISQDAVLIPEDDRVFSLPGRKEGGLGQSSLWYGLNEQKHSQLRKHIESYISNRTDLPPNQPSVIEYRRRKIHEGWEGRGQNRGFIHEKGFRCEACSYEIDKSQQEIWGSGFELHHLRPWAKLGENETRKLVPGDFAVLCAVCHRAIHRTDLVSDVPSFRKVVLANRLLLPP